MKKFLVMSSLMLAMALVSVSMCLYQNSRFSIEKWKEVSGYTGDVCIVTVDTHNRPYCENGVPYTRASVNAGEGYGLWVDCMEYHAPYACRDLNN